MGGTLQTPVGQLVIVSVEPVTESRISEADATAAGYASRDALLVELRKRPAGDVYRIELGTLRADPRISLRERGELGAEAHAELAERLRRLDVRSTSGPWTHATLELIAARPAVRAGDLCRELGLELHVFKRNVRKLKEHGLTESLEVGYRLSPRGSAFLGQLTARRPQVR